MSISVLEKSISSIEEDPHYEARCDLAAVFRWAARYDMHEAIANHFSFAVSEDGMQFLMNPNGRHFSSVRASELLLLDATDETTMDKPNAPDQTAWGLHGTMHRTISHARCLLHLHPMYATALASLKDKVMPAIDQNTARFFNRVSIDEGFDGMGVGDEAERVATTLGQNHILMMGNHGVMAIADTIAEAWDDIYFYERSCRNYLTALSSGIPLHVLSDEVAEKTAKQWEGFRTVSSRMHLAELREILDREEPDYKY